MLKQLQYHLGYHLKNPSYAVTRLIGHLIVQRFANKQVLSGPFKGMKYRLSFPHLPTLIGTYEIELQPAINKLKSCSFDRIINVGAADGYYAVGFGLGWPKATVYAFETSEEKRARILKLAQENGVAERLEVLGTCTATDLSALLTQPQSTLLWVDVEGAEVDLLDPQVVHGLDRATIVVELHEFEVPGCSETIQKRFRKTHAIKSYASAARVPDNFPVSHTMLSSSLGRKFSVMAMDERRVAAQDWFWMTPLSSPA